LAFGFLNEKLLIVSAQRVDSGFYNYIVLLSVPITLKVDVVDDDDDANANCCTQLLFNPRNLTLLISKTPQMSYLCNDLLTRKDGSGAF
jgi:hypothetical protein